MKLMKTLAIAAAVCWSSILRAESIPIDFHIHCDGQGIIDAPHVLEIEVDVPDPSGGPKLTKKVTVPVPARSSSQSIAQNVRMHLLRIHGIECEVKESPGRSNWNPWEVHRVCIEGLEVRVKQGRAEKPGDGGNGHMDVYVNSVKQDDVPFTAPTFRVAVHEVSAEAIVQALSIVVDLSGVTYDIPWEDALIDSPSPATVLAQLSDYITSLGGVTSISGNELFFTLDIPGLSVTEIAYSLTAIPLTDPDSGDETDPWADVQFTQYTLLRL